MARVKKKAGATILDSQGNELMNVRRVERENSTLVIRGKIFGAMPMVAKLTPAEARNLVKLLDAKTALFLLTLLFRRTR